MLILIDIATALFAAGMTGFFDEEPADGSLLSVLEMQCVDTIEEGRDTGTRQWCNQVGIL